MAAAVTYGIVVFKAYRARARAGNRQQGGALALAGDENVQYLSMSFAVMITQKDVGFANGLVFLP